jgi:beta-phosphoglucomutase
MLRCRLLFDRAVSDSLHAIIFDFNGVLADDETPHFICFRQALAAEGLELSREDYYGLYQGMDERNCAAALLAASGQHDVERLQRIIERKMALFREYETTQKPPLFRGVVEFVKEAAARYRLAIASGGRRAQIEFVLAGTPIERQLPIIVSAEDIAIGKPDPGIYRLTLNHINEANPVPTPPIQPGQCVVIEDSVAGIQAARWAGMKVVALATTYHPDRLGEADLVLPSLDGVAIGRLEDLFVGRS